MKTIMTLIGTRPEAIKLAPIVLALKENKYLTNKVCISGQHQGLLDAALRDLSIPVDYKIESHENEGLLHKSASYILDRFSVILKKTKPELVIVQGDTTTAFAGALAAFYLQIPVAHVEAGLRTGNLYSPWPEEAHRCLIDKMSTYFFAPTVNAKNSLIAEGVNANKVWVVGNTSIDAIRLARKSPLINNYLNNHPRQRVILVTVHRRENHGKSLAQICNALVIVAQEFSDIKIIFCLHPNPSIYQPVKHLLSNIDNIALALPMTHRAFVQVLDESIFIITDSGGIQEEASFLGKPALIVRDTTERPEGILEGNAILIGTESDDIVAHCRHLLSCKDTLHSMSKTHLSYGDGYAAERIVKILEDELQEKY
jgi:UDP-N-acetylglucosamine 2-epimerase (non-hydrolysing)